MRLRWLKAPAQNLLLFLPQPDTSCVAVAAVFYYDTRYTMYMMQE